MVAPLHETVQIKASSEVIVLLVNFETLDACAQAGCDLLAGEIEGVKLAKAITCLAKPNHPDFEPGQAMTLITRYQEQTASAFEKIQKAIVGEDVGNGQNQAKKRKSKTQTSS